MTNTTKLFDLGELAEAAYANFTGVNSSSDAITIAGRLTTGDSKFSAAQATEFALHWKVVHHQANTSDIGFSATLFQRIDDDPITGYQAGQYVYAIRGTEGVTSNDLWQEDIGNIVVDGLAIDQIVDMYNDWKRITAGDGNTYEAAQLVTDTARVGRTRLQCAA